jgi:hypothetical protein
MNRKREVYVNVYDIVEQNKYFYNVGFGIYHSGIELDGKGE